MAKAAQFDSDAFVGDRPDMAPARANLSLGEHLGGSNLCLNKRSMVLDEDRFEEQFLRCNVCKELFSTSKLPRMFPCHHSFCQGCVDHLYQTAVEQRHTYISRLPLSAPMGAVSVNCPSCRTHFITTEENIRRLPTDHRVAQLMDFIHHTERYTVTFCSKHKFQPLNFFCELCILPVCRDCTVLEHKETDGHLVMDLEEALAKYTPVLESAITEMDAESECLGEKRIALHSVTKHLEKVESDLVSQVKSCMSRLRELLNEREKTLVAHVHKETEKERSKLAEKAEELETRRRVLSEKSRKLKQAKDCSHVEEMFRVHQEVREYRVGPPLRVREADDGLMTTFLFNTRDEAMLSSRINNFGDVTPKIEATAVRLKTTKPATKPYIYRSSSFR